MSPGRHTLRTPLAAALAAAALVAGGCADPDGTHPGAPMPGYDAGARADAASDAGPAADAAQRPDERDAGGGTDTSADDAPADPGDADLDDATHAGEDGADPGAPAVPDDGETTTPPVVDVDKAYPPTTAGDEDRTVEAELASDDALVATRFVRVDAGALTDHWMHAVDSYHAGVAMHDVDADGDLDVFVGRLPGGDGDPPCVYRNVSTPGHIAFERVDAWCIEGLDASGAHFVPHSVDGEFRAILIGIDLFVDAVFSADGVDLLPFVPDRDTPDTTCNASSGVLVDADHDGTLELVVLCSVPARDALGLRDAAADFVLDVTTRPPTIADVPRWTELETLSMSLALAVDDVNRDGLLDLITIVDTFGNPRAAPVHVDPGGVRLRCAPTEPCAWRDERFVDGFDAWGNFMGVARIDVGERALYYISDFGPNLQVELARPGSRHDEAAGYRIALSDRTPPWLYSWSVVPGDFDGNGLDDLFVTQGSVRGYHRSFFRAHRDYLIAQTPGERFVVLSGGVGLLPMRTLEGQRDSHRGAWRADLDGDGRLDLIVSVLHGHPVVYTVETASEPAWCTLVPEPRIVPTWGYGDHATRPDGRVEHARLQGQTRFVVPRSLVTRSREGVVAFASGARVPFACAPGETVPVIEPDWLSVVWRDEHVTVSIDPSVGFAPDAPIAITVDDGGPARVVPAGTVAAPEPAPAPPNARVMVTIDGRHVARWWRASAADPTPGGP